MFYRIALFILAATGLFFSRSAAQQFSSEITASELLQSVKFLASDELGGRFTGTSQSLQAANFIRDQFSKAGLKLLGDNGFQTFQVVVSVSAGPQNRLSFDDYDASLNQDYAPFPFSKSGEVKATVVFAGYGFEIDEDSLKWDDYEGIDVTGKWVMILRGDPDMDNTESKFAKYGEDREKVLTARDKGATGVIFVSGTEFDGKDDLVSMYFEKTQSSAGIPVFHVKRAVANKILASANTTIEQLEAILIDKKGPDSFTLTTVIDANADIIQEHVQARNVVGLLEGSDPVLKSSYIVIGAHYDHLGMGGPGSGSRVMDTLAVHNGADDNASGTAGIIELAGKLVSVRDSLKRSILFIAFDGEELGLLGSGQFVKNPLIDLKNVLAMVNFDMIGRLKQDDPVVVISGTGTSSESESILNTLATNQFIVKFSPEGYGPSDHASFYSQNIPVFFFSTGAHEDYHTPDDDWDRINYNGEKVILDYAAGLIKTLANRNDMLSFREAGSKKEGSRAGYRFKVTLGIMPDFASSAETGLGVGGVKKDGPAFKGGMLKGDVIIAIDGKQVTDIYDYMNRLKKLQPGQVISVDVMREGKKSVLIIQL